MKLLCHLINCRAAQIPCASLLVIATYAIHVASAAEPSTKAPQLSVEWRLIDNFDDNRFEAELELRNHGKEPIAAPWSLYFNTSARLAPTSVKPPLQLQHVNGDLYRLSATAADGGIAPGDEITIGIGGSPWAISVSDAPSGYYLVQQDAARQEQPPQPVESTFGQFPTADKIRRGASDQVPVVTAEARFDANARLSELPLEDLPPVIPTPVAVKTFPGQVVVDASTVIEASPALQDEVALLDEVFAHSFGFQFAKSSGAPASTAKSIRLKLADIEVDGEAKRSGNEAYTLGIDPTTGIEIVGTDPAGVFYGLQTLRGLIPLDAYESGEKRVTLPAIRISDAPRFGYRGLHLDVARNFQTVATVKQLLELMAFYKLNRFHFHLTDDEGWRFEVASLPELTRIGGRRGHTLDESDRLIPSYGSGPNADFSAGSGFYSRDEFIDILRFARARHIVVIPEIDVPGHSRAAVKAMEVRAKNLTNGKERLLLTDPADKSKYESVQAWRDNVIDVGREDSYKFVRIVIEELAEMYRAADAPLPVIHLGGDEVPRGAWEESPACRDIQTPRTDITRGQQLEIHFLKRAAELVDEAGATPACWDDCIAFTTADTDWTRRPIAYVWNSVWGWGREDVGYRLANAGFDVVLCNATHLYIDLATEKDPSEPGYYWAGFVDPRAPFEFNPLDIYQCARQNSMGQPLSKEQFSTSARLTSAGRRHILGIQGQLWAENLRSAKLLQYMAFPRTVALAERAWAAEPAFARESDPAASDAALADGWNVFANALGQRELPRLHHIAGKVSYRIPPPGLKVVEGMVHTNVAYPGLIIRFTQDGSKPSLKSPIFSAPIPLSDGNQRFRAFDALGFGGRSTRVDETN